MNANKNWISNTVLSNQQIGRSLIHNRRRIVKPNYFRILVYKCGFIFHKIRVKTCGADYSKKKYLVWKLEFCELNHT